jgi:hypothetical protein
MKLCTFKRETGVFLIKKLGEKISKKPSLYPDLECAKTRAQEAELGLENLGKKLAAVTSDKEELSAKWRHCREELDTAEFRCRELERTAEKAARNTQVIYYYYQFRGDLFVRKCLFRKTKLGKIILF